MKCGKCVLALFLCLVLCLSQFPAAVFAEGEIEEPCIEETETVPVEETTPVEEPAEESEEPLPEAQEDLADESAPAEEPSPEVPEVAAEEPSPAEGPAEETGDEEEEPLSIEPEDADPFEAAQEIVASGTCGADLRWQLDDAGTLTISGTGKMVEHDDNGIYPWHSRYSSVRKLVVESGVTTISKYSFMNFTKLTTIVLPETLTKIGVKAFSDCTSILNLTLPANLSTLEERAFYGCSSLRTLTLPTCETSLGVYAFFGCKALTRVTIPAGVGTVSEGLFANCSGLTSVTIANGITGINKSAFSNCSTLAAISIPSTVTSIGDGAFSGCSSIESVTIPDGVTTLRSSVFSGCRALTSIQIPSSVTSIFSSALQNCSSLASITLPDGLTNIGDYAFNGCSSLTSITLPWEVANVGRSAFDGCIALSEVVFEGQAPIFGVYCFYGVTATVWYPGYEESWTESVRKAYGGTLTWQPYGVYTLHYDANGGTNAPAEQTKYRGRPLTIADAPRWTGHSFLGWSEDPYAAAPTYQPGASWTEDRNVILYAVWEIDTYPVVYDANGGSGAPAGQVKTYGETLKLSSQLPLHDNEPLTPYTVIFSLNGGQGAPERMTAGREIVYTFAAWNTRQEGNGSAYSPGDNYTENRALQLYAQWNCETKTDSIELPVPTRVGHAFRGWSADPNASSGANGTYTPTEDATLYAIWAIDSYTVSYNANGGSGAPAEQTKIWGENLTLSAKRPSREGYTFLGWATDKNASTAEYQPGAVYTANAELTLFAVWQIKIYSVSYHANGGSGAPAEQTKIWGENLTLSAKRPSREGYTFLGWATDKNASTAEYQPGAVYTANAELTLFAVWQIKIYSVSYHANGGSNVPSEQIKYHGEGLKLSSEIPTRSGYRFIGWATDAEAESARYQPGDIYMEDADLTLYAVWEVRTYTIRYNPNGGTRAPATQYKVDGVDLVLSSVQPVRTGYTFLGWAIDKDDVYIDYLPGDVYRQNADVILFAMWEADSYSVRYDANGGINPPAPQVKRYGSDLILSGLEPTREGYRFLGWSRDKTAATAEFLPGSVYTENAELTLFAVWQLRIYSVSYSANGGSGAPGEQVKRYGEELILSSSIPVRADSQAPGYAVTLDPNGGSVEPAALSAARTTSYTFKNWNTEENGSGTSYDPGACYTVNADATLFAQWFESTVTATVALPTPVREGFSFLGWAPSSTDASGITGSYTPSEDVILYAIWEEDVPPVVLTLNKTVLTLVAGKSEMLTVTGASGTMVWTSSDPTVATVDPNGMVKTLKAGKTTVTVRTQDGSASASCAVQVLFTDVADSSKFYYDTVYWALENGITTGLNPTTFAPNAGCTREQTVTFLWRVMGCPTPSVKASTIFRDVKAGSWYEDAVGWASETGVTTGLKPDLFGVGKTCTREQFVTFLWRAAGQPAPTETASFRDVKAGAYYETAVSWAYGSGVTTGLNETTFGVGGTCTRGQVVTFLQRFAMLG